MVLGGIPVLFGHLMWPVTLLNRDLVPSVAFLHLLLFFLSSSTHMSCESSATQLWSSLFALHDKCSSCVLSTDLQVSCLCHLCKLCVSYHYFICHLHPALKRGKHSEMPSEWHHNVILRSHHTPGLRPWSGRMRGIVLGTFYVFCAELHEWAGAINLRDWAEDLFRTPPCFGVNVLRLFWRVCADSNYRDARYHGTMYLSFWCKNPCLILLNNVEDITQKVIFILSIFTSAAEDTVLTPLSFAVDRC